MGMKDFDRRFEKAFSMVAFAANRHLVDHMRRLGQDLGLDLETAMIWGILSHLNVSRALPPGASPADVLNPDGLLASAIHPVRNTDVVQVSGLPRETVRRKLERLRELGKVERLDDGRWQVLRSGVDERTYEFTRETVKRFLQTARQIEAILESVDPG